MVALVREIHRATQISNWKVSSRILPWRIALTRLIRVCNWRVSRHVLQALERAEGLRPPLVHAANSAATLSLPEARFDMVRPGIALYGLDPSA